MIALHQLSSKDNSLAKGFIVSNLNKPEKKVYVSAGQGLGLRGKPGRQTLFCLEGKVWVTQEGDIRDYLLEAGDAFLVSQSGLVMVRALTPAYIGYAENRMTAPFRGRFSQTVFH